MRSKIYKLLALIMAFAIMVTSVTVTASAQQPYEIGTVAAAELINPIYEDVEAAKPPAIKLAPKRYLSSGELPFDIDLCITDDRAIGVDLRKVMVDREAKLDVYYLTDHELTGTQLGDLIALWRDIAMEETENSNEGDYLRYHYNRISMESGTFLHIDTSYYYHLPISVGYYTTEAQEEALTEKIEDVIDGFGFTDASTDRQKSDTIYKYITDNVVYDYVNLKDDSYTLKFTAYAALMNKTAVCQGYASLYYRMARECGLETRVITGKSFGENHAWNIVKLYNKFYYLDSTWDAGNKEYEYYLKGTNDFSDHTLESQYLTAGFMEKYPMSAENVDLSSAIGNHNGFAYEIYMGDVYIFAYGGNDEHVVVPGEIAGYPVKQVNKGVFERNPNIKSITFCEGIKRMGESAVEACENLTEIHFPSTMQIEYEKYADSVKGGYTTAPIYCNNLKTITVAAGNPYMKMIDGIIYSADEKAVILCPDAYENTEVEILDGVVDIAPFAFYGCESIKAIELPDSVKMIGYWGFCGARNLENIELPDECRFIGQFALANTKIEEIYIPKKLEAILGGAFGMETDLKQITVDPENQVFYMENGALIRYSSEFETRTILDYETDDSATTFIIPANVWEIEQYAFKDAQNLEKVILHDGVKHIWNYAFENCDSLTHFEFPACVEEIHNYVLFDCDNIMSVIIPSSVTQIGDMLVYTNDGYTIYGEIGSTAQAYAVNHSLKFKEMDGFICTSGHTVEMQYIDEYARHNVCKVCGDCAKTTVLSDIEAFAQFATTEFETYQYTGEEIKPNIGTFETPEGVPLVEGVDYEIVGYYWNVDVGTAYIEVKGIGNYGGTGYIYFQITPLPISEAQIRIEYLTTPYDGYEKCPIIEIDGLNEFENFQVEYVDNVNPGTAKAIITAWGNYEGQIYVEFEIELPATEKTATALYGHDDVKFSWRAVPGADGYDVYYKKSSSSSYTYKTDTTELSYKFANLSDNTKYTFKVVAYRLVSGQKKVSSAYKTATATTLRDLKAPSKVTLSLYGYDDVKVSWSKVSYAKGYYIYYKNSSAKSYTYAGKTTSTSFKKANLSDGVKYTFRVVPYGVSGSKIILDDSYKTASIYTLKKVTTPKITKSSSKKVKVSWANINGESGYQISQSTSKSGTKIVATYSTTSGKSKTVKATKKKTYYYKVRAFVKVGKTVIYGPWSTVKSYKLK